MRHSKEMFLSSCSCCSKGLTSFLSHCHCKASQRSEWPDLCLDYRQKEGRAGMEKAKGGRKEGGRWGWWAVPLSIVKLHLLCHQVAEANNLHDMIRTRKQIKQLLKRVNQLVPGSRL